MIMTDAPSQQPAQPPTPATVADVMLLPLTTAGQDDHAAAAAYLMRHAGASALMVLHAARRSTPQSVLQARRIMRNPGTAAPPQMFVPGTPGCHCPRLGHMITKANVRVTSRLIPVPNNRSSRVRPGTEAGTRTARSGSMATKVAATASATW